MPDTHALLPPLLSLLEQRVGLRLEGNATQTLGAFDALADQLNVAPAQLLERLSRDSALLEQLATQLTVPETHFFRIKPQIDALRDTVLPDLERRVAGKRRLQLWSAGCSTGEEAYTLAMLAAQGLSSRSDLSILGTDLHPESLEVARRGSYRAWSFRDTPESVRERYFQRLPQGLASDAPTWQIAPDLRGMVRFELHNLLSDDWSTFERCDLILCRNVMIYFSNLTAQRVIERLAAQLRPDGWLILGPSDPPPLPATLERCGLAVHYVANAIIYQRTATQPLKAPPPLHATLELLPSQTSMFGFEEPALTGSQPVESTPDAELQLQLGMNALELDDLPSALDALRRAVYLEPRSALAQFLLAQTLLDSGQPNRARVSLRQARCWLPTSDSSNSDSSSDLRRAINALGVVLGEP